MFGVLKKILATVAFVGGLATPMVHASVVPSNEIPFQQQELLPVLSNISRERERNSDLGLYGFKEIIREAKPATPITDCVFMTSQAGRYVYQATDSTETVCGIYVFTDPDEIVEVSFPYIDVPCRGNDLVGVVNGWELNGQYFPSSADHPLPLDQRSSEFCGSQNRKTYSSSQNVALVQYRIPTVGKGFTVSIRFRRNLHPCNVVASSDTEPFTLRNYGRRVNCTFVAIYPAVVRTVALDVGSKRVRGSAFPETETGTIHQCDKRGSEDEVQIGGTDGLDTSRLETLDTICGVNSKPTSESNIIGCEVTTVRLMSSGKYDNWVTITARPADTTEILDANLTCGLNAIESSD